LSHFSTKILATTALNMNLVHFLAFSFILNHCNAKSVEPSRILAKVLILIQFCNLQFVLRKTKTELNRKGIELGLFSASFSLSCGLHILWVCCVVVCILHASTTMHQLELLDW
jgi:hypothetical protein